MSSVRVDISPATPTRKRDISSWIEPDISRLSLRGEKRYFKRKNAIEDYFTTDDSVEEITLRHHLSPVILMKLVELSLMQHEDGSPWGYRALYPGANVTDHTPQPISKGDGQQLLLWETQTKGDSEEVVDASPYQPDCFSLEADNKDVDAFVEDDESTTKRQAINITPVPEPVETIAPTSLNGSIKHQEGEVEKIYTEVATEESEDSGVEIAESVVVGTKFGAIAVGEENDVVVQYNASANGHTPTPVIASQSDRSRTQVVVRESLIPAVLPLFGKGRKRIDVKKVAHKRRSMHKRWIREVQHRRRQRRFRSIVATVVVAALLFVIFLPLGSGLAAYSTYNSIKNVALDGVNHLLVVKDLLPISKSDPLAALDTQKLQQAQNEFSMAESDFFQLQQLVNRSDVQSAIQQFAPQYSSKLGMAQHLVQVGIDVSRMGREVVGVALLGASIVHGSPLANGSAKPLITSTDISNAEGVMVHALYYINDIRMQMSQVSMTDLPISDTQKKELTSLLALMPKAQNMIIQGQGLIAIVSWLLGVDQARHFLVQTMDNGELRPGGGFTGMYGVLTIQNGRMAPFSLQDVTEIDYAGNGMELGRQAPPQYSSWMKFGYWGLRDANLSGDFPTTAKLAMQVFEEEGGGPVDGNIALTPAVIAHILNVIGPIKVAEYNETITAQNLEDKLHYYQQNYTAIAIQKQKTGTNNASTRKSFTNLLGKLLLDKIRHLQVKQLVMIMQNAVKDIQSRDLEIYFTNPLVEAWLVQHSYSGAMDTFSKQDGFMVVQSNISISKASQYVHTTEQDSVVLDAQGGAYHNLTITLNYQQTGPVYGYDTYADYIRVYAPANAQLLGGDGFDSGKCLTSSNNGDTIGGTGNSAHGTCCISNSKPTSGIGNTTPVGTGSNPNPCNQVNTSFSSHVRYCPNGNYSLGQRGYSLDGKGFYWPVDSLGPPTEVTTDMPGRAMWGGLTLTPKNCISTITLQWYVPNVVKNIAGQAHYAILVQKQGGYIPMVEITVNTSAIKGLMPFNFQGGVVADRLFSLPSLSKT